MDLKHCTFVVAMKQFFGQKQGEGLQEFAAELKALTAKDRLELVEMLRTVGYDATKTS